LVENGAENRAAVVSAFSVFGEIEFGEFFELQGLTGDWVFMELLDVRDSIDDIHDCAVRGDDWVVKGLEADCAAIEGEATEGNVGGGLVTTIALVFSFSVADE